MSSHYIKSIYVHHVYSNRNFEIDFSPLENKKFNNLVITGKNGSGKTMLLEALNKELFQYKSGLVPFNNYFDIKGNMNSNEVDIVIKDLKFEKPKVEIQLTNFDKYLFQDLLVIYIPTKRLSEITKTERTIKLNFSQIYNNQNQHVTSLKNNYLQLANVQRKIFNTEQKIKEKNDLIEKTENELKSILINQNIGTSTNSDLNKIESKITNIVTPAPTPTPTIDKNNSQREQNIKHHNNLLNAYKTELNVLNDALTKLQNQYNSFKIQDSAINPSISFSKYFIQYLSDQKEKQAYAFADDNTNEIQLYSEFFNRLEDFFQYLYEDDKLKLKYVLKENNFGSSH